MNNKPLLLLIIGIMVVVGGCANSSYLDCTHDCRFTNVDKICEDTQEFGDTLKCKYGKKMTEFCYNECK